MKNKPLSIVLLLVVGLIWYKVFFRVKNNLFGEDASVSQQGNFSEARILPLIQRDTFAVKANYRDPFSGVLASAGRDLFPVPGDNADNDRPLPVPVYRPEQRWPDVVYYGSVRKTGSKVPLAILKIDGMQFYLRSGESILDNYVVKNIYRDSIELLHNKNRKIFYLSRNK